MDIEQIMDENMGLDLTEDNIEDVLDEIRPYLVGKGSLLNLLAAVDLQPTTNLNTSYAAQLGA